MMEDGRTENDSADGSNDESKKDTDSMTTTGVRCSGRNIIHSS